MVIQLVPLGVYWNGKRKRGREMRNGEYTARPREERGEQGKEKGEEEKEAFRGREGNSAKAGTCGRELGRVMARS